MAARIDATEFDESQGLGDWRFLLGRIEAQFRARSYSEAAAFALRIAEAADDVDHHPDIDLRYPGRIFVALRTHSVDGLTDLDLSLARTISVFAALEGVEAEAFPASRIEVAIDAMDIDAVRPFWAAVLGYVEGAPSEAGMVHDLLDPNGIGPGVWFQQMKKSRTRRNRLHIDVTVPHDQAEQRVAAALDAGGRLVSDKRARSFWILADVEGNEACVCTWQDRG